MIDPTITTLVTTAIEKSVNFALKYDPATRESLSSMNGTRALLKSQSPTINILLTIWDAELGFFLVPIDESNTIESEVQLEGKFEDLVSLVLTKKHSLSDTNVSVSGKIGTLTKLQSIFEQLEIDWEDALTEYLGTVPGHQASQLIRHAIRRSTQNKQFIQENFPEYLTEELKVTPNKIEFELFTQQLDSLRSAADRLEAKIQRIQKNLVK